MTLYILIVKGADISWHSTLFSGNFYDEKYCLTLIMMNQGVRHKPGYLSRCY